jgi:hypothetical protein
VASSFLVVSSIDAKSRSLTRKGRGFGTTAIGGFPQIDCTCRQPGPLEGGRYTIKGARLRRRPLQKQEGPPEGERYAGLELTGVAG